MQPPGEEQPVQEALIHQGLMRRAGAAAQRVAGAVVPYRIDERRSLGLVTVPDDADAGSHGVTLSVRGAGTCRVVRA